MLQDVLVLWTKAASALEGLMSSAEMGMFSLCCVAKMVDQLLQMPLTEDEERYLVCYLQESSEPNSAEVLLMYFPINVYIFSSPLCS